MMKKRLPKYNPDTMESNINGLYLAGVICEAWKPIIPIELYNAVDKTKLLFCTTPLRLTCIALATEIMSKKVVRKMNEF